MHKLALASIAAGILMLAPVTAQTSPTTNGDGQIVIAQRGDGGVWRWWRWWRRMKWRSAVVVP